jgi:hypothetical protein
MEIKYAIRDLSSFQDLLPKAAENSTSILIFVQHKGKKERVIFFSSVPETTREF